MTKEKKTAKGWWPTRASVADLDWLRERWGTNESQTVRRALMLARMVEEEREREQADPPARE